jgi:signal transduction histidine kinase
VSAVTELGPGAPPVPTFREILGSVLRPPLRDHRFWVIQALILAIVTGHLALDLRGARLPGGIPDYPTVGLFLLPVIYAALRFGLGGACASAAWGTVLMLPDLVVVDSRFDVWGDGTLLAISCVVAVAVGQRVEREASARRGMGAALAAHQAAEARFRAIFEASSVPALVVDASGRLRQSNPAAAELFGSRLEQGGLAELIGREPSMSLLGGSPPSELVLTSATQAKLVLHPLLTKLRDEGAGDLFQIAFQDVTTEVERQRLTAAFAAQARQAQEDDRERIARGIHDEPLQTLIYLARRLETVGHRTGVPESSTEELEALRVGVLGVVAELRRLADGLRPPALDDLGLETSIRQLANSFSARTGLGTKVWTRGRELPLDRERRTDVYRVVQEALGNVERHARATQVLVRIIFTPAALRVVVADDGRGFPAESLCSGRGMVAMRERAALAGGRVDVRSLPGHGTAVRVTVPVGGAEESFSGLRGGTRQAPAATGRPRRPAPREAGGGSDLAIAAQA